MRGNDGKYAGHGIGLCTPQGWRPKSRETLNDWAERIHPDERAQTVSRCMKPSLAGVDHETEYRVLSSEMRSMAVRVARVGGLLGIESAPGRTVLKARVMLDAET